MTEDMRIYIDDTNFISYKMGVPQGACLSPVMFNIYFQQALKLVNPYTDRLLAYADDTALINKSRKGLKNILKTFELWDKDFNLKVNDLKTEIMCVKTQKPDYIPYNETKEYKYLGVQVSRKKNFQTKTRIMNNIKDFAKRIKLRIINNSLLKVNKLVSTWWFISIVLYQYISDVMLGNISSEELAKSIMIEIKKML